MAIDENKTLSRRQIEMWQSGYTDDPNLFLAENYINHQESDVEADQSRDLQTWKDLVAGFHTAFSDSQVEVLMQIAEGDRVATRWRITATHTGPYMDLAEATNNRFSWTGVLIDRIEGDKIAETWVDWDQYRFFQGMGLIPKSG